MKRAQKPWTKCAQFLGPVLEALLAARSVRIEGHETVWQWVASIPFQEVMEVDSICRDTVLWTPGRIDGPGGNLLAAAEEESAEVLRGRLATQLAMRMCFAMDLARHGPPSMQRAIPWTGDLHSDLQKVLVSPWHGNALWWVHIRGNGHPVFLPVS